MPRGRPPSKTKILQIRLSAEERQLLSTCAYDDGMELSTWIRAMGLREARSRLREQGAA